MNKRHTLLLNNFFTTNLGPGWESMSVRYLGGMAAIEALWPLNDLFHPHYAQIKSLPYSKVHEAAANKAIEDFSNRKAWKITDPKPIVWRVLLERQTQSILLASANEAAGNSHLIPLPSGLPKHLETAATVLFLQWSMRLPYPVKDRSNDSWPEYLAPESLARH